MLSEAYQRVATLQLGTAVALLRFLLRSALLRSSLKEPYGFDVIC